MEHRYVISSVRGERDGTRAVVAQAFKVGAAPAAAVPVVRRYGFSDVITYVLGRIHVRPTCIAIDYARDRLDSVSERHVDRWL